MIFIPVAVIIILTYCLYQRNLVVSITTGILITVVIVFLQILALLITNFSLYLLSITLSIEIHRDICQILYMLGMLITAYYMWINQDNIYEKVIRYCETKSERTQRYVKYIKFGITLFLMLTFTVLGEGIYDKLGISNESFMLICFTILLAATIFFINLL